MQRIYSPLTRFQFLLLSLILLALQSLDAGSFRFNNRVIHTGMSKGKVFFITGQPDWKTAYLVGDAGRARHLGQPLETFSSNSRFTAYSGSWEPELTTAVEEWLFNRGRYRFMLLLRFEDERLVAIEELGYGYSKESEPATTSDWSRLQAGDTAFEVLRTVGEPSLVETKPEIAVVRVLGPFYQPLHFRSADVEWWYYNAGKNRLFRIAKLVNGRVVEIQTEGFGVGD